VGSGSGFAVLYFDWATTLFLPTPAFLPALSTPHPTQNQTPIAPKQVRDTATTVKTVAALKLNKVDSSLDSQTKTPVGALSLCGYAPVWQSGSGR